MYFDVSCYRMAAPKPSGSCGEGSSVKLHGDMAQVLKPAPKTFIFFSDEHGAHSYCPDVPPSFPPFFHRVCIDSTAPHR